MPASAISEQIPGTSLMRLETGGEGEWEDVCVRARRVGVGACLSGFYVLVPTRDHICSGSISANHLSLSAANKLALSGTGTRWRHGLHRRLSRGSTERERERGRESYGEGFSAGHRRMFSAATQHRYKASSIAQTSQYTPAPMGGHQRVAAAPLGAT